MSQAFDATFDASRTPTGALPPASEEDLLPVGSLVAARYRIDALLGQGGMGAVYRAHDTELSEDVALKVLHGHASDPSAIERFRREVKLARRVTHPNVARTFDLSACGDFRFLTMELIEGSSLARKIESGGVTMAEALRICADVARGLVAAHSAGVVHRDLKPDNVMLAAVPSGLTAQERVVITDFGIARGDEREGADERPESQRGRALTVGGIVGTPAYMAPEQILGETPDGRTDVYALGVVLFEMLTGRLPFEGDSPVAMATARLTTSAPDPRSLNGALPEHVAALVLSLLSRDRRQRPDSASVLEQLERIRGGGKAQSDDPVAALAKVPGTTTMILDVQARLQSVAVLPLTSVDPSLERFARDLGANLADSLARGRQLRVIPPAVAGDDLNALVGGSRAEVALTGGVRAEGDRLRVNLRVVDLAQGNLRWSDRFEGSTSALFAIEDTLVRAAEGAIRALAAPGDQVRGGPSDPALRALYDRALEVSHRMNDLPALEEALSLMRKAHQMAPGDASIMSLMGLLLVRAGLARRDADRSQLDEAEEWALRALDADASAATTFEALGLVRLHQGDHRSSVRAFREALARDPRSAEASAYLGRFLSESGFMEEGIKRLEFALRLEPGIQHAWWNLIRTYALVGQWDRADATLQRAQAALNNEQALSISRTRIAFWREDREFAAFTADRIEALTPPGHFHRGFIDSLRAFAAGQPVVEQAKSLYEAAEQVPSPALKAFWFQVAAEVYCLSGRVDAALDAVERTVALAFIDVGWMDHCPILAKIRGAGRFGQARAIVAARAANLWK